MADIGVVKRRSNGWVWWIVAALVIVLLLIFLLPARNATAPARSPGSSNAPAPSPSVQVA